MLKAMCRSAASITLMLGRHGSEARPNEDSGRSCRSEQGTAGLVVLSHVRQSVKRYRLEPEGAHGVFFLLPREYPKNLQSGRKLKWHQKNQVSP